MITIDCPFCAGEAHVEPAANVVSCDGCDVTVDIAPDAAIPLEAAA